MLSQTGEHNSSSSSSSSIGSAKHHHRAPGMVALYRDIIRHEGVWGLWAGNGANLLRVFPAKAIVFSSNDIYKAFLFNLFIPSDQYASAGSNSGGGSSNNNISLSGPLSFFAGGLAGMSACFLTYPRE
jgi:Mitochondrial carrier protein